MVILQAIIDGILVGGFYALMACGLTLVFGVMDIVNFAQGILVVLGAYLSYALYSHLRIDPFLSLPITIPVMFLIGVAVYWTMIKPIKQDRVIMSLLTMFAVGTIIEGVLDLIFTSNLVQIQTSYATSSVRVGSLIFPNVYLYAFAMSAAATRGPVLPALPDQVRAQPARVDAEHDSGPARRDQHRLGGRVHARHRGGPSGGGGDGVRPHQLL